MLSAATGQAEPTAAGGLDPPDAPVHVPGDVAAGPRPRHPRPDGGRPDGVDDGSRRRRRLHGARRGRPAGGRLFYDVEP